MRHDLRLAGPAFELRPVEAEDAGFILGLRRHPELSRYLHPTSPHLADQEEWMGRYFEREDDIYFLIVRRSDGCREGTVALYDIEPGRHGEWGRWILKEGSMAAVESAWLVYRAAFELLGLDSVHCRTAAANRRVVSFHTSCGLSTGAEARSWFRFGDEVHDMVEQRLTRQGWEGVEPRLKERAAAVARMLER